MEWIEKGLRESLNKDACSIIESLLKESSLPIKNDFKFAGEKCQHNHKKEIQTIFGKVIIWRTYYYAPSKGEGRYPFDEELGLVKSYSPGLVRLMTRAGARESYESASEDLKAYGNIEVDSRQINRMVQLLGPQIRKELEGEKITNDVEAVPVLYASADGTGTPMRKEELKGVKGKQADGSAKTKEVKVGCVFTSHPREGEDPLRDWDSTSYVATLRNSTEFGTVLRQEALRRGMGCAHEVVFIGDGAAWVWEIARTNFKGSVEILDYYHASEHLTDLANLLMGKDSPEGKKKLKEWKELLFCDGIEILIQDAKTLSLSHEKKEELSKQITYFEKNKERMRYGTFRKKKLFIGSGVVEAGCKNVVGARTKKSGMFWSKEGAENVLGIRAALYSNRFDSYWDKRNGLLTSGNLACA